MTDGKRREHRRPAKAQSESIGLVFIFGIVIVSISIVLAAGLPVIDDARENTQIERFQTEFGLLDQEIRESVYAPGESGASISLSDGRVSVDNGSDSMTMTITYDNGSSEITTGEIPLGGIEYDAGGDRGVAYQGGGVWAKYRNGLSVRDPPDITYTGTSLNINMINFTKGLDAGGTTTRNFYFSSGGTRKSDDLEEITDGPLGPGELEVSVRSEFSQAWGEYFSRNLAEDSGTVDVSVTSPPDDRGFANVTFETGPPLYSVENSLNHTGDTSADVTITGSDNEINITDSRVGDVVLDNYTRDDLDNDRGPPRGINNLPNAAEACFRTFEGEDLGSVSSPVTSGTYETSSNNIGVKDYVADGGDIEVYSDTNQNINSPTTFDTSGGNVEIHVDGQLTLNGDIEINGTNSVYFYVRDTVHVQGNSNVNIEDGRTERLQILTSSDVDIKNAKYNGTVYAQSGIDILNDAEVTGAAVSAGTGTDDTVDIGDKDYTHDASTRGAAPDCAPSPLRNFDAIERLVAVR